MAEHTPGPWGNYPPEFTGDKCWTVQGDGGMTVRVCGGDTPENQANARLIASAPELLAALKNVCRFERFIQGMNPSAWPVIHAAINKAEGRNE